MAPPLKPNQISMPQAPNDRQLRQKFILPLTTMVASLHCNSVPVFRQNPLIHSPKRAMTNDSSSIETLGSRLQLLVGKPPLLNSAKSKKSTGIADRFIVRREDEGEVAADGGWVEVGDGEGKEGGEAGRIFNGVPSTRGSPSGFLPRFYLSSVLVNLPSQKQILLLRQKEQYTVKEREKVFLLHATLATDGKEKGTYNYDNESITSLDLEAFTFDADQSFGSVPSVLPNCVEPSEKASTSSSASFETDSSINNYATGRSSPIGATFFETLFSLYARDQNLEKEASNTRSRTQRFI
ncbi:hypothetical protein VIGAN_11179700 [Vigna angularis var. angularis]|uniref:Uncharacterized protein n=1 Tax=Vigna angularis var. angularis TaxID=157739 RepID=A0A0S3TAQ3_PHAAN|nr:hypothetical protein VIGAN_11179700 [Vigna angularis var. angularis]